MTTLLAIQLTLLAVMLLTMSIYAITGILTIVNDFVWSYLYNHFTAIHTNEYIVVRTNADCSTIVIRTHNKIIIAKFNLS